MHIITDADNYQQKIDDFFNDPFILQNITFSSDVFFEDEEFKYLVDLQPGTLITKDQIKKSISYLIAKNKFSEIHIQMIDNDNGKKLHFDCEGFWTFKNLKIRGILIGKEAYRQYYVMEPGDRFDQDKHAHSIEKIYDTFKKDGFFNGSVETSYTYDKKTKDITVQLHLKKGQQFSIENQNLAVHAEECATHEELLFLKTDLYRRFLRHLEGSKYAKKIINHQAQLMKQYLAQKGFLHVSIELNEEVNYEKETINLNWSIILHHKRTFIFWGNRALSSDYLLDKILLFGRSAWLLPASILAEEIAHIYHEKGYWKISVESQEDADRYFFIINEGQRARIKDVQLKNVYQLEHKIIIGQSCKDLLKKTYYSKQLLDQAFNALTDFYIKNGFLEAKIIDYEFIPIKQNDYSLIITIDEGKRSYLASVFIEGDEDFSSLHQIQILKKEIELAQKNDLPGLIFSPELLQKYQHLLVDYFHRQGYIHASIKPNIEKDSETTIKLTWHVQLGSKMHFGKTIIAGGSTFPFYYMMREVAYHESDIWDQEKLRQTFLNIKDLEIFDGIQVMPYYIKEEGQKNQPVLLKVKKDDPFEIRLRTGFELQEVEKYKTFEGITYKIGGAFIYKNPFNFGDQFRFDLDFTRLHREVIGKYQIPWLFTIPLRTTLQGYTIKHNYPVFVGTVDNIYTITQQGFLIALHKRKTRVETNFNIGIEWMETTVTSPDLRDLAKQVARAINFEQTLLDKTIPYFFIEPTIYVDLLDNKVEPRRGALFLLSLKGMVSLGKERPKSHFLKLLVEQSLFWPFGPFVGAFRFRFGHIFHNIFNIIMPNERFYLGGSHSIRSYETDFAPPLGEFIDKAGKQRFVPRGGKSMINVNAELRMPLSKHVGFVLFQDFGALNNDKIADIKRHEILAGTGFGVRYNTPIGPLRFDIGWKWKVLRPVERSFAWFLTFGHAF